MKSILFCVKELELIYLTSLFFPVPHRVLRAQGELSVLLFILFG